MSEEILKGYVINRINFNVFDEIVVFLTKDDEKISCMSLGSRKIQSKNSRNLFLGNYVEFEIFKSRSKDKLSKLKKVTTIKNNDWEIQKSIVFMALCEIVSKTTHLSGSFDFFEDQLESACALPSSENKIIYLLRDTCLFLGLNVYVNGCCACGSKVLRTFVPKEHGFLCPECIKGKKISILEPGVSKIIFSIFAGTFNEETTDAIVKRNVIKILTKYIDDNCGIFIKVLEIY